MALKALDQRLSANKSSVSRSNSRSGGQQAGSGFEGGALLPHRQLRMRWELPLGPQQQRRRPFDGRIRGTLRGLAKREGEGEGEGEGVKVDAAPSSTRERKHSQKARISTFTMETCN